MIQHANHPCAWLGAALVLTFASAANAATIEIGPADDLQGTVNSLQPGDELVLQGGVYTLAYRFAITVSGTEQAPILIRSKDNEVAIIEHDASQNTINVENNQWVVLRNLEVRGGGAGIRLSNASFITVSGCHIHDTGDVALSANIPGSSYQGLHLVHNHIHNTAGTGEGMYLGCNDNGCQVFESVIEGNYIHDTKGPNVSQGDGIELKEGSHDNVIRDNVIHDTGYPCIITYATVGNGNANVIERNALWACGDMGIQSAADAIIRNNIILGEAGDGIHNQPHQAGVPGNLTIVHNTVLVPGGGAGIRTDGIVGPVVIANNAFYGNGGNAMQATGDLGQLTVVGNVGIGPLQGISSGFDGSGSLVADFVSASFSGTVPNDVFPATGGKLVGTGDVAHVADDDFNGTPRGAVADVGAYRYDPNGNPGWVLEPDFKDPTPGTGGNGAGGSGTGGNGTGGNGTGGNGTGAQGASSSGASGPGATPSDSGDEGGCGCRLGQAPGRQGAAGAWLLALGLLGRRRSGRAPRAS